MRHIAEVLADNIPSSADSRLPPTSITVIVRLAERLPSGGAVDEEKAKGLSRTASRAVLLKKHEARLKLYEESLQKLRDLGLTVHAGYALPILLVSGTAEALAKLETLPDIVSVQPNFMMETCG